MTFQDGYDAKRNELVLECVVQGFPVPKITWVKDGSRLHMSSRHKFTLDADGKCRLVVQSPGSGDSGSYTCVAQNASFKDEISAFVVVPGEFFLSKDWMGVTS